MESCKRLSRRSFLQNLGMTGVVLSAAAADALPKIDTDLERTGRAGGALYSQRKGRILEARRIRERAMKLALNSKVPSHRNNGEEGDYPFLATYTKGLKHNDLGEVDRSSWNMFAAAIASGKFEDFEKIPMTERKLKNPLAGLCFEVEGTDCTLFAMKPAPRIDSAENSAEMCELYWEALCRDISFTDYDSAAMVEQAASDLSHFTQFAGPKSNGKVTPACVFRGNTAGDLIGPYISQFLLLYIPVGVPFLNAQNASLTLTQTHQTVQPGKNYLTDYGSWLHSNNGLSPYKVPQYDSVPRYIRNGRDLANTVHVDVPWQFAIHAAYVLLNSKVPYDQGTPYLNSKMMEGFGTFGYPHLMSLIGEAAVRATRAVWFQKWWVHRRLRPETFGGRLHNHLRRAANYKMIHEEILNASVLDTTFKSNQAENSGEGSYLLPQVYPEGCQLHPAYASGHAAMIGGAVTVLKAWFDETAVIPYPVVPNDEGTDLIPYNAQGGDSLTVGGELDKLASNIAIGRNWAGIHWRSDAVEGMKLGESVAIRLLQEQNIGYCESASFSLTKFDGTKVTIR